MATLLSILALVSGGPEPSGKHRYWDTTPPDPRVAVVAPYRGWLKRLAWCESTNRPWAVDPSGTYYGLYQFDLRTWASVGGRGLPSSAPRLEQSYRAVLLLKRRGTAPWPVCG